MAKNSVVILVGKGEVQDLEALKSYIYNTINDYTNTDKCTHNIAAYFSSIREDQRKHKIKVEIREIEQDKPKSLKEQLELAEILKMYIGVYLSTKLLLPIFINKMTVLECHAEDFEELPTFLEFIDTDTTKILEFGYYD